LLRFTRDLLLRKVGRLRQSPRRCMSRILDPEQGHLEALRRLGDFRDQRILELGCGDGRLTIPIAAEAAFVFAFDPDEEAVESARHSLPSELANRVAYEVASGDQIEIEPTSFDLALFSWSL
jgi:2-polyprenyl-3-methyl-5-hydroxy-6-metoxy-1,4-benzoquinol methylase